MPMAGRTVSLRDSHSPSLGPGAIYITRQRGILDVLHVRDCDSLGGPTLRT